MTGAGHASAHPVERIQAAYGGYEISELLGWRGKRYQAKSKSLDSRLYAVITDSLEELEATLQAAS